MMSSYLISRLYGQPNIDLDPDHWRQAAQDIDQVGEFTWRVWMTTEVSETSDSQRIFGLGEEWQPLSMVATAAPTYLRVVQDRYTTTFTVVSVQPNSLESLVALVANLYAPVDFADLGDQFLQRNDGLSVTASEVIEPDTDDRVRRSYAQPVPVRSLLERYGYGNRLQSLTTTVEGLYPDLDTRTLHIDNAARQIWISVEEEGASSDEKLAVVDGLIALADGVFLDARELQPA